MSVYVEARVASRLLMSLDIQRVASFPPLTRLVTAEPSKAVIGSFRCSSKLCPAHQEITVLLISRPEDRTELPESVWSDSDVKASAGGRGGAEMSIRSAEGMSIMQALAMTVAEIPVFLYSTFGQSIFSQLKLSPSLKKVLFATALGSVALALTAHQLKRRGRKRKQAVSKEAQKPVGIPEQLLRTSRPASLKRGPVPGRQMMSPSTRSNDTLSGVSSLAQSKHSSSSHSIASVHASPLLSQPIGEHWDGVGGGASGRGAGRMELFEEALRKWELALNIRHRAHSHASGSNSLAAQGSELVERHSPELHNHQFAEKLETLLHRAYHLQEDFGSTIPPESLLADLESEATLILPTIGSSHPIQDDDAMTVTSDDSFFSAAEVRTHTHTHTHSYTQMAVIMCVFSCMYMMSLPSLFL
ncbi:Mitoguardin 2 [Labeo rohita]|uniref:Mitoguardin 2 n=1 Tax=Labeo rohita TaxID=84645 RepID=A0ABQ8LPR2_LABRO|nr:Mitoguardin 2 [Labeo rohita]